MVDVGYRDKEFVGKILGVMRVERQQKIKRKHLDCVVSQFHEEKSE